MFSLLQAFIKICFLQQGPESIPYSPFLLKLIIGVYAIIAFLALMPIGNYFLAVCEVAVEIGLAYGFVWGLLAYFGHASRFVQTACAFFGVDALISFMALPAIAASALGHDAPENMFSLLILMIWEWIIYGAIISKALSKNFLFGLSIALLYSLGFYQVMEVLFPR